MPFSEDILGKYASSNKFAKPDIIWKLLFKELHEYCTICEEDRMICVLSPQCSERVLLKTRIQAGAGADDLPKFCYAQQINNLKRYLEKKTTLYEPKDVLLFNADFIEIMFPHLYSKIIKFYHEDVSKIHEIIGKSRIPAVKLDLRNADASIFRKIIQKDKMIKEGTFIYDISGEFLVIWFEGTIFFSSFESGITMCNAKEDLISDSKILDVVFHVYCAENNLAGNTIVEANDQISLVVKIPFSQIEPAKLNANNLIFDELIKKWQLYFFSITLAEDSDNNLIIILKYKSGDYFLERYGFNPLTFQLIKQIIKNIDGLRTLEQK